MIPLILIFILKEKESKYAHVNIAAVSRHILEKSICILDGHFIMIYFTKQDEFVQTLEYIRKCSPEFKN
ncbi:MAG: hypothetical protein COA79_12755 [Planctomycetota bacterium]|nr:MAG: hypothetical protein COA79_12755 [Planctomycetota bacterium]